MGRSLASVQIVDSVEPIFGSDNIEKIRVLGWTLVARKGEFRPGDKCFYFEVDSILPEWSMFDFMKSSHYRIRAKKIRSIISMGLAIPVRGINRTSDLFVGQDVTEEFEVKKWEPKDNLADGWQVKGPRPKFVPKSDETRIQFLPSILGDITEDLDFISTVKYDGTPGYFYFKDGEFGVCSRNMEIRDLSGFVGADSNVYWYVCNKYNIQKNLHNLGINFVIQGEICGPGINKNRLGLKEPGFYVFDVYDISRQEYFGHDERLNFCEAFGLEHVEVDENVRVPDPSQGFHSFVDDLLEQAKGAYPNGYPREGIVVRTKEPHFSAEMQGRISFKVLNSDHLLKE